MFVAEKMSRVNIVVLRGDLEAVLDQVARTGVLHPAPMEELEPWAEELGAPAIADLTAEYERRRQRIARIEDRLPPLEAGVPVEPRGRVRLADLGALDSALDEVEAALEPVLGERAQVVERLAERRQMLSSLETLARSGLAWQSLLRSTFLAYAVGTMDEKDVPRLDGLLAGIPSVVFPFRHGDGGVRVLCVVLRKDRDALQHAVTQAGLTELPLPDNLSHITEGLLDSVRDEVATLERAEAEVTQRLGETGARVAPALARTRHQVEAALTALRIECFGRQTDSTCILTGWVPRDGAADFARAVGEATSGRAVVEVMDADTIEAVQEGRVDVPVAYDHPAALKPFEPVVEGYGVPSYRMVDPTPFVATAFLVMFGMMFGDVGHGLVLLAAGLVLGWRQPALSAFGRLAAYCGASSMVFGALYGSVFGWESLLPALWVRPLEDIGQLFGVAIALGVLMVSLGVALNVINAIRTRRVVENLFEESGPVAGLAYWAGVGVLARSMLSSGALPGPAFALGLLGVLLVLFLAKDPVMRLLGREERMFPEGVVTWLIEAVIHMLEALMGYVANTVSFIRVAAFGLAHAGLFVTVFSLADIVSELPGGRLGSWLVIVLGNVLVIALEGLVVTIQVLRLEYYEFCGRFFGGSGVKYEPVRVPTAP